MVDDKLFSGFFISENLHDCYFPNKIKYVM